MSGSRILIIADLPFCNDAGAPRVNNVLAHEFRRLGHVVDTFGLDDTSIRWRSRHISPFVPVLFRRYAIRHVQRHGQRYDIIQAEQGNLPVSKERLGFQGLLVAQSNGLAHFYHDFEMNHSSAQRRRRQGRLAGRILRRVASAFDHQMTAVERGLRHADLIVTINDDETEFVSCFLGYKDKVYCRQNGLSQAFFASLSGTRESYCKRLARPRVAFIGNWSARKGADDWPMIVRQIRQRAPEVTFLLLGTILDERSVVGEFDLEDRSHVAVVPRFQPAELPALLKDATVGAFPSYVEGFPLAVLEKLAAGLPVVAYENPGCRRVLSELEPSLLVPTGKPELLAERVLALLSGEADYVRLSELACKVALRYRWDEIAEGTAEEYLRRLTLVRKSTRRMDSR